jgi:MOSC domain-containing protein YiiM
MVAHLPLVPSLSPIACTLVAVLAARARPFGPQGKPSAIGKTPLADAVFIDKRGLSGDEQGDVRHHGGAEKAVHQYPFEHYTQWRKELPSSHEHFERPGTFGENFSSLGMTEDNVCVGDEFQAGNIILQVSQARQPCWKLDVRVGVTGMASKVQDSCRTGWYYRVLQPGSVQQGDTLALLRRPNPDWPLRRLLYCLYIDRMNMDALAQMSTLAFLAQGWRNLAQTRLRLRMVEDWSNRLGIPGSKRTPRPGESVESR